MSHLAEHLMKRAQEFEPTKHFYPTVTQIRSGGRINKLFSQWVEGTLSKDIQAKLGLPEHGGLVEKELAKAESLYGKATPPRLDKIWRKTLSSPDPENSLWQQFRAPSQHRVGTGITFP